MGVRLVSINSIVHVHLQVKVFDLASDSISLLAQFLRSVFGSSLKPYSLVGQSIKIFDCPLIFFELVV